MKSIVYSFLFITTFIANISCNGKNSEANKNGDIFYAVCADDKPAGWCSEKYSAYDSAKVALDEHKKSTKHTDNRVDNDCPFAK